MTDKDDGDKPAVSARAPSQGAADGYFVRLVSCIARWCIERPAATIVLFVLVALGSAAFAASALKVDTNPALMIRTDLPFRQSYRELVAQFPAVENGFVVIVDADSSSKGRAAATRIAAQLRARPDLFSHIFAPGTGPYFDRYGVLYLDEPAIAQIAEGVKQVAPMVDTMALQPDLAGLVDLFQQMSPVVEIGQAPAELAGFLDKIAGTVEAVNRGQPRPLDWTALGEDPPALAETRWYVLAKPILDFSALDPAAGPIAEIRRLMADLNKGGTGIKVQLTGEAALNAEEFDAVTKGMAIAGPISFALVVLTVIIGFPSLVLVIPAVALVVLGFLINVGFATVAIGSLNMISVAFAVLFIGLGIDYAAHVILRFAEERAKGSDGKAAAIEAVQHMAAPLGLCMLTTSLAFLAFAPTDFVGMAQLGIIATGGVVIAFIASVTLVPALLCLLPGPQARIARRFAKLAAENPSGLRRHRPTLRKAASVLLIVAGLASLWLLPQARFDGDPINLKDPAAKSMIAFNDLVEHQPAHTFAIQLLSQPGAHMREIIDKLKALPQVSDVETVEAMMPSDQEPKLARLNALADLLPTQIDPAEAMSDAERRDNLQSLLEAVTAMAGAESAGENVRASAARLQRQLQDFIAAAGSSAQKVRGLEASLVEGFPKLFDAVHQLVTLDRVTLDNLSDGFKRDYIAPDGRWRLDILPKGNMRDPAQLKAFVDAVVAVAPKATGGPVEIVGAARAVSSSVLTACLASLVLVFLVTFAVLRRIGDVLLALAPLVLAGALMVGYTVVFHSPFNFANVIVLPLLIGLGIHSAIHYVMRAREQTTRIDVGRTWTPRAVVISAVTTMGSFGTLGLSAHRGMASMGELLTVAIMITLLCTLVVLPQLIAWFMKPGTQGH